MLKFRLKTDTIKRLLGRRQVVRHRLLVPAFGGSNPSAPATKWDQHPLVFFRATTECSESPSAHSGWELFVTIRKEIYSWKLVFKDVVSGLRNVGWIPPPQPNNESIYGSVFYLALVGIRTLEWAAKRLTFECSITRLSRRSLLWERGAGSSEAFIPPPQANISIARYLQRILFCLLWLIYEHYSFWWK